MHPISRKIKSHLDLSLEICILNIHLKIIWNISNPGEGALFSNQEEENPNLVKNSLSPPYQGIFTHFNKELGPFSLWYCVTKLLGSWLPMPCRRQWCTCLPSHGLMAERKESGNEGPPTADAWSAGLSVFGFPHTNTGVMVFILMSLFLLVYEYVIVTSDRGHTKNLSSALTVYHCGIFSS